MLSKRYNLGHHTEVVDREPRTLDAHMAMKQSEDWPTRAPATGRLPSGVLTGHLDRRITSPGRRSLCARVRGFLCDNVGVVDHRDGLRRIFDQAADRYPDARPESPERLFDALGEEARLQPGDRLLEVGCGPGKATLPLARRGYRIRCVELGPALAAAARANLADFPDVDVIEGAFETYEPACGERFDLVFAATAWHWVAPSVRYQRAWQLLRPGGHLATWSAVHVFPEDGRPVFRRAAAGL